MALNETKLAYLAGIFDGEGTICIVKANNKTKRGFRLIPKIGIVNTNPKIIDIVKEHTNCGSIYDTQTNSNWKPVYRIYIQNMEDINIFLEKINPYLILKKEQGILLVEFIKLLKQKKPNIIRNPKNGQINGTKMKIYSERELEIYNILKQLNKRGNCS